MATGGEMGGGVACAWSPLREKAGADVNELALIHSAHFHRYVIVVIVIITSLWIPATYCNTNALQTECRNFAASQHRYHFSPIFCGGFGPVFCRRGATPPFKIAKSVVKLPAQNSCWISKWISPYASSYHTGFRSADLCDIFRYVAWTMDVDFNFNVNFNILARGFRICSGFLEFCWFLGFRYLAGRAPLLRPAPRSKVTESECLKQI